MRTLIALAATLLSAACALPSGGDSAAEERTLWLQPGELGGEAQVAWGLPLPEGFQVVRLAPEAFRSECEALPATPEGACHEAIEGAADLPGNRILVRDDLTPELERQVLVHEMGHILRGRGGHIHPAADGTCAAVMCETGHRDWPEAEDFDFVLPVRN